MKLIIAAVLAALLAQAPHASQSGAPSYTYQGTVHAVQTRAASLDVITAVGMAFRMVHITVVPATHIEAGGAPLTLRDLGPGDVVRADCHLAGQRLVADKIEKLRAP